MQDNRTNIPPEKKKKKNSNVITSGAILWNKFKVDYPPCKLRTPLVKKKTKDAMPNKIEWLLHSYTRTHTHRGKQTYPSAGVVET